jgi:predicted transcriptional regulator
MTKDAAFTMKLEPELRADFMAEAQAAHRPGSQVLRELIRDFVQRQRQSREYDEFLASEVAAGQASMRAAIGRLNEEVEAVFSAKRAAVAKQKCGSSGRRRHHKTAWIFGAASKLTICKLPVERTSCSAKRQRTFVITPGSANPEKV